ncbi:lytic transglycosylase domain-containing protein [Thermotoga sp. KOL6]|uniref:lytic transglycosylase domain-containing protein n=1 Tax=Thermotoga sp. KOL6 TaxID=126741 RepID=UPI000C755B74|nr:lytic transglycosylase domain-containing protein [Thermotoga sp. KOL6]PLV59725.1 lytic transglycosylase [Thermotoga sp. KOL6]
MRSLFLCFLLVLMFLVNLYRTFPDNYYEFISNYSYDIDPRLVQSIIWVESNFNEKAVSPAGAFGLMQLMPSTAEWLQERFSLDGNFQDPECNILYGIFYLRFLRDLYGGDMDKAIMAYNVGPTALRKGKNLESARRYLKKVKRTYLIYRFLYHER